MTETLLIPLLHIAGTVLSIMVGVYALRVYFIIRTPHLLHFSAGFILMGISIQLLTLSSHTFIGTPIGIIFEWSRMISQTISLVLIATAYYTKTYKGHRLIMTSLIGLLLLAALTTVPGVFFTPPDPFTIDVYFYALNTLIVIYIFAESTSGYLIENVLRNAYVPVGFGFLAFSEYTWFLWTLDRLQVTFILASSLRILALGFMVWALRGLGGSD